MNVVKNMVGIVAIGLSAIAGAYEQPEYTVLKQYDDFEIRRYPPYLIAETSVGGTFEQARNDAFRRLFDYISGNNRAQQKIAMTVPVTSQPVGSSEQIEMTAPVTTMPSSNEEGYIMQFALPKKYTLENVPQPLSPSVHIRLLDGQLVAVRTYSGRSNEASYRENEAVLLSQLKAAGYTVQSAPSFAVYNSPFTPWFMRRNEVIVPIEMCSG